MNIDYLYTIPYTRVLYLPLSIKRPWFSCMALSKVKNKTGARVRIRDYVSGLLIWILSQIHSLPQGRFSPTRSQYLVFDNSTRTFELRNSTSSLDRNLSIRLAFLSDTLAWAGCDCSDSNERCSSDWCICQSLIRILRTFRNVSPCQLLHEEVFHWEIIIMHVHQFWKFFPKPHWNKFRQHKPSKSNGTLWQ